MSGVNVLRFSALGLGVLYGFNHQRAISASDRQHAAQKEYENKAKLISDAKAEYQRKNNPETLPKGKGKGFDFTSASSGADFDLEAFLHLKDGQ